MGLKLFTFAYNTLLQQTGDTTSSLFLPKVLAGMKDGNDPYLPIKVNSWSIASIPDAVTLSSAFATTWFTPFFQNTYKLSKAQPNPPKVTQKMIDDAGELVNSITSQRLTVIACPNSSPSLDVSSLEILGLSNIKATGSTPEVVTSDNGYNFTATLDFNAYPSTGENWNQALALGGQESGIDTNTDKPFFGLGFTMQQCLCFAKSTDRSTCVPLPKGVEQPTSPCNPSGFVDTASGQAVISVDNTKISANATISISENGQSLVVTVNKLTYEAESGAYPTYKVSNLGINATPETENYTSIWSTFIKNTMQTQDAAKSFTEQINSALNNASNLKTVESTMTTQLNKAIDDLLGAAPANFTFSPKPGTDSNEVDQYIFKRTGDALNVPSSDFYLPKTIFKVSSPTLEPYQSSAITIPGTFTAKFVGVDATVSEIQLPSGLSVTGASNLIAPEGAVVFASDVADATFELGRLNPGPTISVNGVNKTVPNPPLNATSTFSMMVQIGSNNPLGPFTGNIAINVQKKSNPTTPAVNATLNATGSDPNTLAVDVSSLSLQIAPDEVDISVKLDADGSLYNQLVDSVVNQDTLKSEIISALNSKVTDELAQISSAVTQIAKQQLTNIG